MVYYIEKNVLTRVYKKGVMDRATRKGLRLTYHSISNTISKIVSIIVSTLVG